MKFEALRLGDLNRWQYLLQKFPVCKRDIFFDPSYLETWERCGFGVPVCLVGEDGGDVILYPFMLRRIDGYDLSDEYYDISSAYGYGGAVSCNYDIDSMVVNKFDEYVGQWCSDNNVIAEFIRVYPGNYLRNVNIASSAKVRSNAHLIVNSENEIWNELHTSARRNILKAQKCNVEIDVDYDCETIDHFAEMYLEMAGRKEFGKFYHFPMDYFMAIKKLLGNNTVIINAKHNETTIASVLCFVYGEYFTYHLGASTATALSLRPNDLLYWIMIQEAIKNRCAIVNWGGGTSLDINDKLLSFKMKFSNVKTDVYIKTRVRNDSVYNDICNKWYNAYPDLKNKEHYFMKYREIC